MCQLWMWWNALHSFVYSLLRFINGERILKIGYCFTKLLPSADGPLLSDTVVCALPSAQ